MSSNFDSITTVPKNKTKERKTRGEGRKEGKGRKIKGGGGETRVKILRASIRLPVNVTNFRDFLRWKEVDISLMSLFGSQDFPLV